MHRLFELHTAIDTRVASIREHAVDWPCAKGCDSCCRQLAEEPQLSAAEWQLLHAGLTALPPEQRRGIRQRIAELTEHTTAQRDRLTCPMLDPATGACPVYAQRPVACRTYGFYVQRDKGLYCADIEARVAAGRLAEVIWGNHDGIEQQLARLGETHPLSTWFAEQDRAEALSRG